MTTYDYNDRMAALCARAERVMNTLGNPVLSDVYAHAGAGFASKAATLPVEVAKKPVSNELKIRLSDMEDWVSCQEIRAAYVSKETKS